MKKITDNWATVRMVVYSGIAVVCGGLVLAGIITEDQSHTYLGYIGSGLGALGVILASANVSKPQSTPEPPQLDVPSIADAVAARVNVGVQQAGGLGDQFVRDATATVEGLRRQAEQAFGEYRNH
jgi:hypothetical protein